MKKYAIAAAAAVFTLISANASAGSAYTPEWSADYMCEVIHDKKTHCENMVNGRTVTFFRLDDGSWKDDLASFPHTPTYVAMRLASASTGD
jgi:hypothetical protein